MDGHAPLWSVSGLGTRRRVLRHAANGVVIGPGDLWALISSGEEQQSPSAAASPPSAASAFLQL